MKFHLSAEDQHIDDVRSGERLKEQTSAFREEDELSYENMLASSSECDGAPLISANKILALLLRLLDVTDAAITELLYCGSASSDSSFCPRQSSRELFTR